MSADKAGQAGAPTEIEIEAVAEFFCDRLICDFKSRALDLAEAVLQTAFEARINAE